MRVWDGVTGAMIDFDVSELGLSAPLNVSGQRDTTSRMSTMVELSNLQQAMLRFLDDKSATGSNIDVRDAHRVERIIPGLEVLKEGSAGENEFSDAQGTADLSGTPDPWPVLDLSSSKPGADKQRPLRARLLIGADGPNSPVRTYAGIGNYGWSYGRRGLVGTLRCRPQETGAPFVSNTAWQRFLPSGPIAFLPVS